jgi:hypothetical protein
VPVLLNGAGLPTLQRCRSLYAHGHRLGRLARPRHAYRLRDTLDAGFLVGLDNDAFSDWSLDRFVEMIGVVEAAVFGRILTHAERAAVLAPMVGADPAVLGLPASKLPASPPNLLFVTVPDVPFDGVATLRRFAEWAPMMPHLPLAFCVQDGAGAAGIPWNWPGLRCLFMAGSTDYKLSVEMAAICREGKRRGLWIHAGRVNSRKRIRYLHQLDCVDSLDGTGFDQWRDANLPWGLEEAARNETTSYQLNLL